MKKMNLFYICNGVTSLIFLIVTLWGLFFMSSGDEMGYALLSFYLIIPVSSFVIALIISKTGTNLKWMYPVIFGMIGFFIPTLIFHGSWGWFAGVYVVVPALLGLIIGTVVQKIRARRNAKIDFDKLIDN